MAFDLRFGHPTNLMITGPTQVSLRIVYLKIPIIYNFFFLYFSQGNLHGSRDFFNRERRFSKISREE
jgi:hypothetical protein